MSEKLDKNGVKDKTPDDYHPVHLLITPEDCIELTFNEVVKFQLNII